MTTGRGLAFNAIVPAIWRRGNRIVAQYSMAAQLRLKSLCAFSEQFASKLTTGKRIFRMSPGEPMVMNRLKRNNKKLAFILATRSLDKPYVLDF